MKISDRHFYTIFSDALSYEGERAAFVSDHALGWEQNTDDPYQEPLDVNTPEFQERLEYIAQIWDVAHMPIREMATRAGLTQTEFATKFCIKKRTAQDWWRGVAKCPDHTRLLIAQALKLIER